MYKEKVNIFWFRRDLRLEDNLGFCKALQGKFPVLPLFIFDPEILETLPKDDARVSFIYIKLQALSNHLKDTCKSSIAMYYGNPLDVFEKIVHKFDVQNVITNRDYEPYALVRDKNIENFLSHKKISF